MRRRDNACRARFTANVQLEVELCAVRESVALPSPLGVGDSSSLEGGELDDDDVGDEDVDAEDVDEDDEVSDDEVSLLVPSPSPGLSPLPGLSLSPGRPVSPDSVLPEPLVSSPRLECDREAEGVMVVVVGSPSGPVVTTVLGVDEPSCDVRLGVPGRSSATATPSIVRARLSLSDWPDAPDPPRGESPEREDAVWPVDSLSG